MPVNIKWGTKRNGEVIYKKYCVIGVRDTERNVEVIHPISDFIVSRWGRNKYNTQRKRVNEIIPFLNYLKDNRHSLGTESLSTLGIEAGTTHLNSLTHAGNGTSTVKEAERTLTEFYVWLAGKGILETMSLNDFKKVKSQYGTYYESPFNCEYPSKKPSKLEHLLPMEYIPLLFELATIVAKPITLGLYIQIFGGLRVGEVLNIKRTQSLVRARKGDFTFKLEDQNFRTDIKHSAHVKKPRYQTVMNVKDWLPILMNEHLSLYKPNDGSDALFVNRDGKAMSERSYRQHFDTLKQKFIKFLKESKETDAIVLGRHLESAKWSTHIGRGTFTNMIAEHAQTPNEIAHHRGDSNIQSSLTYMSDTIRLRDKLEEKLHIMHNNFIPRLIKKEMERIDD